ncbi:hypothetical protein [Spirosoma endophyticum]|uniref:Uncharacterized protein n=1 Tax=Spirosoma endophyticum TaxID=662367 RepID=A0A1I1SL88_9BACT|nr:hypothetical protein [Spirosoma endophyticum]SFD47227.1 hypothetical protein SAMN05216167_105148 [Spirosoma endophyticum]
MTKAKSVQQAKEPKVKPVTPEAPIQPVALEAPIQPIAPEPPVQPVTLTEKPEETKTDDSFQSNPETFDFLAFLNDCLTEETLTDDERTSIVEIIDMVKEYPEQDAEFIKLFVTTLQGQLRAYHAAMTNVTETLPTLLPEDDETDVEEDDRAERLRANAQSELAAMRAASRQRQEAAGIVEEPEPADDEEELDPEEVERAERLKANAQSELNVMLNASLKRQETAEALAQPEQVNRRAK